LLKLLFQPAFAELISISDSVAFEIPRRLIPRRTPLADGMVAVR
jgi:hypothetical protein